MVASRRYALVLNLFVFLRVEGLGGEGAAGGTEDVEMRNVQIETAAGILSRDVLP